MTLTLSSRDVELVARVSRALATPGVPTLERWWLDTNCALLELFHGDHAMCMLPGVRALTMHIDDGALGLDPLP